MVKTPRSRRFDRQLAMNSRHDGSPAQDFVRRVLNRASYAKLAIFLSPEPLCSELIRVTMRKRKGNFPRMFPCQTAFKNGPLLQLGRGLVCQEALAFRLQDCKIRRLADES